MINSRLPAPFLRAGLNSPKFALAAESEEEKDEYETVVQ
jgi:hypothetical protein